MIGPVPDSSPGGQGGQRRRVSLAPQQDQLRLAQLRGSLHAFGGALPHAPGPEGRDALASRPAPSILTGTGNLPPSTAYHSRPLLSWVAQLMACESACGS
jgi:hypothetical protein